MIDVNMNQVVRSVSCPHCLARSGERCKTASGKRVTIPHKDRLLKYWRAT